MINNNEHNYCYHKDHDNPVTNSQMVSCCWYHITRATKSVKGLVGSADDHQQQQ